MLGVSNFLKPRYLQKYKGLLSLSVSLSLFHATNCPAEQNPELKLCVTHIIMQLQCSKNMIKHRQELILKQDFCDLPSDFRTKLFNTKLRETALAQIVMRE